MVKVLFPTPPPASISELRGPCGNCRTALRFDNPGVGELVVARAAEHLYGMNKKMRDCLQRFGRAPGAAGQIDDQRFVSRHRDRARQYSSWGFLQSFAAHLFRDAWNDAVGDRERS